ncbi:MAG: DUF2169 domain-containing protein, partial [Polyangiaceae bacterium]|nr:DUF2169 domain-containing protein [Polyangiaceae bacterium]
APSMPFQLGEPPLEDEDATEQIPGAPLAWVQEPRAPAAILAGETLTLGPSAPAEPVAPAAAFFHAAPRAAAEAAAEGIPRRGARLVPFAFDAPLSGLTVAWQVQPPRDAIAVVIKGSFDLVHGGRARLRAEPDAPAGDVHLGDDPRASVLYPSDFAILKPRADVTLAGHAYPPAGGGRTAHARFRFGREGAGFDRSVAVIGDRSFRDGRASPPRPFSRMPLVYERAYGGPDFDRNPVGLGRLAAADGSVRLPNLEDPRHLLRSPADAPPPLCFCGVPMLWRARWSKIGTYDEAWVRRRWPWFPEDFDWSFFQAAPPEQQVDRIAGDEPFLLAGMHPELPVIEGELPHLDVRCFAQRTTEGGGAFHEIPVRLDTVAFDADAMKIGLVWRGLIEVRDDDAPEIAELFVMTGELGGPRATLEEARDRLAAIKAARAPVVDPVAAPEAPANDAAPAGGEGEGEGEGGRVDALDAEIEAHAARVRAQLAAAGVALPAEGDPDPAPPPMDPRKLVEQMRAAGASAEDVAAMEDALRPEPEEGAGAGAATGAGSGGPGPAVLRAEVVARLEAGEPLAGMDLAGADLSGLDLSGRSLAGANLKEARLAGCRLARADLAGAQIGRADLTDAILDAADLTGADLYGATLAGARFAGAKVGGADFSQAAGQGADFKDAAGAQARFAGGDWARAGFVGARLPAADFTGARLDDVLFDGADLPEVRLFDARGARASFAGARMEAARADGACFTRSSFKGAVAPRSLWEQAVLDGSSFLGATLTGAGFVRASCREASFAGADLVEGRFRKADLAGASLLKANLMKASLEAADLSGADLRAANLHGAELWKARLSGAQRELAILTRTKLERRS